MNVVHGLRMEALTDIAACSWCTRPTSKRSEMVFNCSVKLMSTDMVGCLGIVGVQLSVVPVEAAKFSCDTGFSISSSSDFEHHMS